MSRWVRWAAIAFAAIAIYGYLVTGDPRNDAALVPTGAAEAPVNSRDERLEMPTMTVEVVAEDDWRSAVDSVLLQLFDPPDFELRIAEYPETPGTWRTASALLTPRAEAGDPDAQYLLSRAAHRCFHGPRTLDELEARLARAGSYNGPFHLKPDVAPAHAQLRATYEFCADSTRAETAQAIDWVIAAADAGNIRAQIAYSETHFPSDPARLDYPYDEREAAFIEERRARSLAYLERAKAAGSVDAMSMLFGRHLMAGTDAFSLSVDPSLADPSSPAAREHRKAALANLYAPAWFRLRNPAPNDRDAASALRIIQRLGAQMPAHEYQEAMEAGRAILGAEGCCLKFRDIK
jgi:hypothetical protein